MNGKKEILRDRNVKIFYIMLRIIFVILFYGEKKMKGKITYTQIPENK